MSKATTPQLKVQRLVERVRQNTEGRAVVITTSIQATAMRLRRRQNHRALNASQRARSRGTADRYRTNVWIC